MSKLNRILWAGLVLGVAACGDDVTVTNPPEPTPGIRSVTVSPSPVTVEVGKTVQMAASITLDPGATGTPSIAWSTSAAAVATVGAGNGLVTAVAPGSAAITATVTLGTSVAQGAATVNVVAAATCSISGVSVSPESADLVIGQTLAVAANVSGANCTAAQLGVTYSTSNATVATVNSTTGLVTAVGAGSATITATSVTDASKKAAMSVSVVAPTPATVTIQSITQFATNVPVDLSNVGGQIEVTLNIDPGSAPSVTKAQVLIGGTVVAEQTYGNASAGVESSPALAVSTVVLSTNTRQVRKPSTNYVPVIFNGPSAVTARIFVAGSTTPAVSNAIPVVMQNKDGLVQGNLGTTATNPSPSFLNGANTWYKGGVSYGGGSYVAFFPVTPTKVVFGSTLCPDAGTAPIGSPTGGLTFGGTLNCAGVEGSVALTGTATVTAGTAPAADVIYLGNNGWEVVGTKYVVNGDDRWNLLSGSFTAPATLYMDNKGPVITPNEIGYLSNVTNNGCSPTIPNPGCWINGSYNLKPDFPATDGGSGAGATGAAATTWAYFDKAVNNNVCGVNSFSPASAAEDASPTKYDVCATVTDPLGNGSSAWGFNAFGVDKTSPTMSYNGTYTADTLADALPNAATLWRNFLFQDGNSGLDNVKAVKFTTTGTTLNGACAFNFNTSLAAGNPLPSSPRPLVDSILVDFGCGLPGYYYLHTQVEDRAGNTTPPISRKFGYEPGVPSVVAINVNPLYGGTLPASVDAFMSHTGASLMSASMGITYNGNTTESATIVYPSIAMFNAPWAVPLYLNTPASGADLTVPGTATLAGLVIDSTVAPASSFDSLYVVANDVCGAKCVVTTPANHTDTLGIEVQPSFKDTTKISMSASVWATPNLGSVLFENVNNACTVSYETSTNGPTIPTAAYVVNQTGTWHTLIQSLGGNPTLVSDNGIIRKYRYAVASTLCANLGANLKLVAVKNDTNGLPVGYLVQ